jgi:RsmE family RNA methyltransferase
MSLHRFFTTTLMPSTATDTWVLPLSDRDFRHLLLVLRLEPGDRIMLADPSGLVAEAVIRDVSGARVTADVAAPVDSPARPRVALAQGLARRERMEFVVQKATELGVSEIVPVAFVRSVVKLSEDRAGKRTERWRRIAEEAAKQSQRAEIPLVREPVGLAGLLCSSRGRKASDRPRRCPASARPWRLLRRRHARPYSSSSDPRVGSSRGRCRRWSKPPARSR